MSIPRFHRSGATWIQCDDEARRSLRADPGVPGIVHDAIFPQQHVVYPSRFSWW